MGILTKARGTSSGNGLSTISEMFSGMRALALFGLLLGQPVCCHAYPDRPLTLVVPFPTSGSADISGSPPITKLIKMMQSLSTPSLTDVLAQDLAHTLSVALGQPVNLKRRPSGKTIAGARYAAQAAPDGYTLLFAGNPTITIFPSLYQRLPFDPMRDLIPVASMVRMPIALIAASDNPAKTVRDVIERAQFMPGQINYAVVGDGTTAHLTGESFRAASGIEIVHVSYNGSLPAINAVITRNIEFGFVPLTAVLPYLKGGKVRIISIASAGRHPAVPEVPTIAESGLDGFEASGWFGVFAPARTSGATVSLLNYEINRALSEESLQRMLSGMGLLAAPGTPEEFRVLIENDRERWAHLLKTLPVH
jgi:tripartite-type tricarboxylate transporter receptor subunit TctC